MTTCFNFPGKVDRCTLPPPLELYTQPHTHPGPRPCLEVLDKFQQFLNIP